jgi:hypothetical protein
MQMSNFLCRESVDVYAAQNVYIGLVCRREIKYDGSYPKTAEVQLTFESLFRFYLGDWGFRGGF